MHTIRIPQVSKGSPEVTVGKWHVAQGEPVKKGQVLLDLEAADSIVELLSGQEGTLLNILLPEGSLALAGAALAFVGSQGENIEKALLEINAGKAPVRQVPVPQMAVPVQQHKEAVEVKAAKPSSESKPAPITDKPVGGAVTPILMPQAGQSMEEGTILAWKVKEGDQIGIGDIIFDIETDKATIEVEAVDAGKIARIVVDQGQTVPVKTPVAYLADNVADVDAFLAGHGAAAPTPSAPAGEPESAAAQPAQSPQRSHMPAVVEGGRVNASPAARKLAAEKGLDLAAIGAGAGPGGRILRADVEAAQPAPAAQATEPIRRKMSPMRKAIARNLLASKQNIPHFYMRLTVNAQKLFDLYRQTKEQFKCSVNDFVVCACAKTIREFPAFRSRLDNNEILELPGANIGIAVGMDDGLVVPVLLNAEKLSLKELALRSQQIAADARAGKIAGMGQGVFTITNLGMFGIEEFAAIINPPEVAILAVGAIHEGVIVADGAMKPSRVMTVTLSADHRVIDGMLGAKFLAKLKERLESPEQLL